MAKGYSQTEKKDEYNDPHSNFDQYRSGKKDSLTVSEHLENIFQNRQSKEKQSVGDANSGRKHHHTLEDFLDS